MARELQQTAPDDRRRRVQRLKKMIIGIVIVVAKDKLQLLPGFLEQLEGKSGTLQMENYEEGKGKFTFKPDA